MLEIGVFDQLDEHELRNVIEEAKHEVKPITLVSNTNQIMGNYFET